VARHDITTPITLGAAPITATFVTVWSTGLFTNATGGENPRDGRTLVFTSRSELLSGWRWIGRL
jgi:hypothetical protein